MKYCSECGRQLEDDAIFCSGCAAPQNIYKVIDNTEKNSSKMPYEQAMFVEENPYESGDDLYGFSYRNDVNRNYGETFQQQNSNLTNQDKKSFSKLLYVFASVLIIVALFFGAKSLIGSGAISPKTAVKGYLKASYGNNAKKIAKYSMCKPMYKAMDTSKKEYVGTIESAYTSSENSKIKNFRIKKADKWNREDVKEFRENFEDVNNTTFRVTSIRTLTVSYKSNEYDSWENREEEYIVYKYGGKWYVLDESSGIEGTKGVCSICGREKTGVKSVSIMGYKLTCCKECKTQFEQLGSLFNLIN